MRPGLSFPHFPCRGFFCGSIPGVLLLLSACGRSAPPAGPPIPVKTAQVAVQDVPLTWDTVGTVESVNSVQVCPRVSGQLLARHFQEGQRVQQGDRLFSLDPAPFEAKAKETEAQRAREEASLVFAEAESARIAQLHQQHIVSRSEGERASTQVQIQREAVRTAREAAQQARLNLDYCQIQAPLSGQAGAFQSSLGATVEAFKTALVSINQLQPIHVGFSISEKELPRLQAARKADPKLRVQVRSAGTLLAEGRLSFVDNAVDRATGMLKLKAVFANDDQRLWPGQFVDCSLVLAQRSKVLVIPTAALMNTPKGAQVFVLRPDHTVELRPIVLDPGNQDWAVVREGLKSGERVIVEGQNKLRPGSKVALP